MNEPTDYSKTNACWELRCRFLVASAWILGVGMMESLAAIAFSGLVLLGMLVFLAIPLKRIRRNGLVVLPFLFVSFLTLLFSDGVPVTKEAANFALLIFSRMTVCVLAVSLVAGNAPRDYLDAFQAMKFPTVLVSTLYLTQRYVHVIGRQFSATRKALVSRLFFPRLRMRTLKTHGRIIGGMTLHAIDRSEHIRKAMESRGFQGRMRSGSAAPIRWTDVLKSVAALSLLAVLLLAERWYLA